MYIKRYDELEFKKFVRIPKSLFSLLEEKKLKAADVTVYSLLLDRLSLSLKNVDTFSNEDGEVYVTYLQKDLQRHLGMSNRGVQSSIERLVENEVIRVDRPDYRGANLYFFNKSWFYDLPTSSNEKFSSPRGEKLTSEMRKTHRNYTNPIKTDFNDTNKRYSLYEKGGVLKVYAEVYEQYKNKKHPTVTLDQLNDLEKQLSATDVEIYPEIFRDMAHIHFKSLPKGNDGNILAFVGKEGRSPLQRYCDLALELPF